MSSESNKSRVGKRKAYLYHTYGMPCYSNGTEINAQQGGHLMALF